MFDYFDSKINKGQLPTGRIPSLEAEGFVSFQEIYRNALSELSEATSIEEHNLLLNKYSDVLIVSDSAYIPKIMNPFYQKICNRQGMYESNGYAHKVMDSDIMIVTQVEHRNELQKISSISGLDPKVFRVASYTGSEFSLSGGRINADCGDNLVADFFFKCKKM